MLDFFLDTFMAVRCGMGVVRMKQGEGKWLRFNVTFKKNPVDLTGTVLRFGLKEKSSGPTCVIVRLDGEFDKSQESLGIVRVNLDAHETAALEPRVYQGELEITFASGVIVGKSLMFNLKVLPSVL